MYVEEDDVGFLSTYTRPVKLTRKLYYQKIFPFESIYRFVLCGHSPEADSPQCRVVRLECAAFSLRNFARVNREYFRWQLLNHLPRSIHIGAFAPFHLPGADFLHEELPDAEAPAVKHVRAQRPSSLKRPRPSLYSGDIDAVSRLSIKSGGGGGGGAESQEERKQRHRRLTEQPPEPDEFIHILPGARKELVFDLDVPDFDRFCGCVATGANNNTDVDGKGGRTLCWICWLHVEGAYFILNHRLQHELGYATENTLWVFSGGKGLHCFINEKRALTLSKVQRDFLLERLTIGSGRPKNTTVEALAEARDADRQLREWLIEIRSTPLCEQLEHLFRTTVLVRRNLIARHRPMRLWVLAKLRQHYPSVYGRIRVMWQDTRVKPSMHKCENASIFLWELLVKADCFREDDNPQAYAQDAYRVVPAPLFIIARLYYPVLDAGPMQLAHDVKLPFSFHGKTGNLALPIDGDFILSPTEKAQALTMEALYDFYRQNDGQLPEMFTKAVAILDRWLSHYG
jgi:DNA primase catalytic subunit